MIKTPKNPLHHKINENTEEKTKKSVKINVIRAQEINLKACRNPECLLKKNCLIVVIIARLVIVNLL